MILFHLTYNFFGLLSAEAPHIPESVSVASLIVFGFGLGLKHAIEADHIAAVSTIVSERKSILSASLVGGLWGIGHTISLLVAGLAVLFLHFQISERLALILEFGVALMLIGLGLNVFRKLLFGGKLHVHQHRHGELEHAHPHLHERFDKEHEHSKSVDSNQPLPTHHKLNFGLRPLLIGLVHGMAGSAALMLLVLATVSSPIVGLIYILVFGVGSVGGMMLMSALVSLPMRVTMFRFEKINLILRYAAGSFSFCLGLFMVYEIGSELLRG